MIVRISENIAQRVFALNKHALKALIAQERLFVRALYVQLATSMITNARLSILAKLIQLAGLMSA
jgi:hypothetical protein